MNDVILRQEEENFKIRIHARIPKESGVKPITLGLTTDEDLCLNCANWSPNSIIFEGYHYKPFSKSTIVSNSSPEKRITLEAGVESTGIYLGMATNINVDETKASNMIHA
ncbi:hypothetical protein BY458DRAFT_561264 [Sporodiniella umbellata]|nr:hypothetical protein BY458DRAFT_561264 [Sporodiniella umbellata]